MTTCSDIYNGSSCGGNDCDDRYCYDCNACENCKMVDETSESHNDDYSQCDHIIHADRW